MLVNVLPTRVICQKNMAKAKAILRSLFSTIHSTLSQTLSSLFGIPVRDSGKIVNRTMDEVVEEWVSVEMFNEQIVSVDAFSKDNFVGNFLRLSELRNGRYFDGQKKKTFNSVLATVYEYFSGCTGEFLFLYNDRIILEIHVQRKGKRVHARFIVVPYKPFFHMAALNYEGFMLYYAYITADNTNLCILCCLKSWDSSNNNVTKL